jgi:phosphatidylserine/phosphatidylglycerophosphate/cardiolipin synthase-like enzyme
MSNRRPRRYGPTADVPIWIDRRARIAHAKTMVIDSAVTLAGSHNWTAAAAANFEDLNLVASPAVSIAFEVVRLAVGLRLGARLTRMIGAGVRQAPP